MEESSSHEEFSTQVAAVLMETEELRRAVTSEISLEDLIEWPVAIERLHHTLQTMTHHSTQEQHDLFHHCQHRVITVAQHTLQAAWQWEEPAGEEETAALRREQLVLGFGDRLPVLVRERLGDPTVPFRSGVVRGLVGDLPRIRGVGPDLVVESLEVVVVPAGSVVDPGARTGRHRTDRDADEVHRAAELVGDELRPVERLLVVPAGRRQVRLAGRRIRGCRR